MTDTTLLAAILAMLAWPWLRDDLLVTRRAIVLYRKLRKVRVSIPVRAVLGMPYRRFADVVGTSVALGRYLWDAPKAVKAPPVRGEDPETRETVGYGSRKVHHATDTHR